MEILIYIQYDRSDHTVVKDQLITFNCNFLTNRFVILMNILTYAVIDRILNLPNTALR